MKLKLNRPDEGKSNGEIHLYELNEEEYYASKEELHMLFELIGRINESMAKKVDMKKVLEDWNADKQNKNKI